jgi:hypothetical protein
MPSSIINSDDGVVSGTSGLKSSGGDDGVLVFQSKGTETARINTDKQIVAAAGTNSLPALTTTGDLNTGIYFPAADTIGFVEGGAEAMRIDSSGNVGIGTSTPARVLHVKRTAANQNVALFESSDTAGAFIRFADPNTSGVVNQPNLGAVGDNLVFTLNTERMRIDSSGNLLVGTTTSDGTRIRAIGSSTNDNVGIFSVTNENTAAAACAASFVTATNSTATSNVLVKFGINNYASGSGQINANGANACAFGTFSDRRIKENIEDLPSQLNNILALRPVEFDFIESQGGGHQIGFIAQEFEEVYPDAVGEAEDGIKTLTGWDKTSARLVKAIQELKAELDTVKAELATLKGN